MDYFFEKRGHPSPLSVYFLLFEHFSDKKLSILAGFKLLSSD